MQKNKRWEDGKRFNNIFIVIICFCFIFSYWQLHLHSLFCTMSATNLFCNRCFAISVIILHSHCNQLYLYQLFCIVSASRYMVNCCLASYCISFYSFIVSRPTMKFCILLLVLLSLLSLLIINIGLHRYYNH